MHLRLLAIILVTTPLAAQAPGKWPPDSLINTKVIPHDTPVNQVIGTMRNFTSMLGVRCHTCHEGEEGTPLEKTDFASDKKRMKLVARQMMRMVEEINHRLDTIPERPDSAVQVTCRTCHRGVSRPEPLYQVMTEAASAGGADSSIRAYQALRQKYYGRDSYDFGELSLNQAAFRLGQAGKFDDAFALLRLNEGFFPGSSGMAVFQGNIYLMKGDTNSAANAFREAIERDTANGEAKRRLQDIGAKP
jgi:Photosynthetic reaction centre cytochrome C subunit